MIAYRYLERGITGLGCALLAGKGIAAHRERFVRLRSLPVFDGKLGKLIKSDIDPFSPDYWTRRESVQREAWLTHRIKCLCGLVVV